MVFKCTILTYTHIYIYTYLCVCVISSIIIYNYNYIYQRASIDVYLHTHHYSSLLIILLCAQTFVPTGATRISRRRSSLWPRSWNRHTTWTWWPWGRGTSRVCSFPFNSVEATLLWMIWFVCYNVLMFVCLLCFCSTITNVHSIIQILWGLLAVPYQCGGAPGIIECQEFGSTTREFVRCCPEAA